LITTLLLAQPHQIRSELDGSEIGMYNCETEDHLDPSRK